VRCGMNSTAPQDLLAFAEDVAMTLTKHLTERGRCEVCRIEFQQPATGRRRRYCSDAHRVQAHYWRTRPRTKAFQRIIRERTPTLAGCYVEEVTTGEARQLILRYEWLAKMPVRPAASYGLKTATGALLGVAVFGWTGSPQSRDICGKDNRSLAICLERGACAPDAPDNAASFLVSRAIKMAAADQGWRIFFAYADPQAGEVGTIYQACNWLFIGDTAATENYRMPDGTILSERSLRHRKMKRQDALDAGAEVIVRTPKHKYVTFTGDRRDRSRLRRTLRYEPMPYPSS
jgi:hypothetical protein